MTLYIAFEAVGFAYREDQKVITGLELGLAQGECTAVIGPNGSGKTTLGKLAAGILKPDRGRVAIEGCSSRDMSLGELGTRVGYLFQEPERQLFAPTVAEELSLVMDLRGADPQEINEKVEDMLARFELAALRDSFPFLLSRGEKQRLALAAILINEPEYIILDEPTTGLDVERRRKLSRILSRLREQGVGMMIISHDHDFIRRHADRIIELRGGAIAGDRIPRP